MDASTFPAGPPSDEDRRFDLTLRPQRFADFVGQESVVRKLQVFITAARQRQEPLEHVLLSGLPGLGKTTLAQMIAAELGVGFHLSSGPAIERAGDVVGLLTQLRPRDVLFIDEIHRLPAVVEEYLYSAMEDFRVTIMIDQGPHARSVEMAIQPFTLIGATTREGLLSAPLRSRFGVFEKLEPYSTADLARIVTRSAGLLEVDIHADAATAVATRSRGTPRYANRFLRRVRDLAQVRDAESITADLAREMLAMMGVDDAGLDPTDRKILEILVRANGRAVGLKTIAAAAGETDDTIEEVYEPFLLREGFLERTPRGRVATERAYRHLGIAPTPSTGQGELFS